MKRRHVKLFLYISIATLTSLMSDLRHHLCFKSGEISLTTGQSLAVIFNLSLQGLIAWRAFLDDSTDKDEKDEKKRDIPSVLSENKKEH